MHSINNAVKTIYVCSGTIVKHSFGLAGRYSHLQGTSVSDTSAASVLPGHLHICGWGTSGSSESSHNVRGLLMHACGSGFKVVSASVAVCFH
jgi:hypothetical protein